MRVKCKSKWNGKVFVCTTNVNRLNYQPLFGNISPRSCPWSHFSREGAKTGHKKAAEVEPTMCKDEIECNGALSVTGGLEVLFADVRSLVFAVGGFSTFWQRLVSVAYVITIFWLVFGYWVIHKVTACLGITNKRSPLSLSVTTLKSVELYSSLQRRHVIWCVIDQSLEVDLTLHPWKMQQWVLSSELSITTKSLQLFFPASKISISFNIAMRKLSKCHSLFPFCLARFLLISFGNFFLIETRMSL